MKKKSLFWLLVCSIVGILLIISMGGIALAETKTRINIGGGTIGGSTNLMANALAGISKKWLNNIEATVISIPGMASADMLHKGICQITTVGSSDVYEAYMGIEAHEGKEAIRELRRLIPTSGMPLQILVRTNSDIKTFKDLVGKRISPGSKGMTAETQLMMLCKALGIAYPDDFASINLLGHKEGGAALIAGKIHAYSLVSEPPHPTFTQVDFVCPLRLLSLSEDEMTTFLGKYPYFTRQVIPPEFYHMDTPAAIFGFISSIHTTTLLPEDVAYELVKNWVENPEYLGYYHVAIKDYLAAGKTKNAVENTLSGIPYHVGALRYFKEIGWSVPAEMIPPEAR